MLILFHNYILKQESPAWNRKRGTARVVTSPSITCPGWGEKVTPSCFCLSQMGVPQHVLSCPGQGGTPSSPGQGVPHPLLEREYPHPLLDGGAPSCHSQGTPRGRDLGSVEVLWDEDGVTPGKDMGTSQSNMEWRWGCMDWHTNWKYYLPHPSHAGSNNQITVSQGWRQSKTCHQFYFSAQKVRSQVNGSVSEKRESFHNIVSFLMRKRTLSEYDHAILCDKI